MWLGDVLRVYIGLTGALVLLAAATTSISGFTRLAPLARRAPAAAAELRAAQPAHARLAAGDPRCRRDLDRARSRDGCRRRPAVFLASLYSFGVLLAFAAAQLAVLRLRVTEPDLPRPFRAPLAAPLIGAPLAMAVWVLALVTHPGARYAGPAWLALGVAVYVASGARSAPACCTRTLVESSRRA